ncbi:YqaA family protein [Candidatus Aenigmatarchaeota archaeon]
MVVTELLEWSREALLPLGPWGLFLIAFMESSFFPIPPDLLLIPLVLAAPELAIFFAVITTAGSVLGALLGYFIGIKGGRPVLLKIAGERKTQKVEDYFNKYGDWGIGIAGFTPVPYKIFTIAAGVFRHNIPRLIGVSIVTRGARFFAVALVTAFYGEQIILFLEGPFGLLTLGVAALGIVIYFVYRKIKK